jgi:putative SOS response-associated peptidase YedK
MCGRYTQTIDVETLQRRFGFDSGGVTLEPRYNLAPGQEAPVVVEEGAKVLKPMRWGLVPYWAKEASIGYKMINARAETLAQKPSFKKSFREKRCLVLADGFYEWHKLKGKRTGIPMRFILKSREPFAFAGLWDAWKRPEGDILLSFTIITTEANELLRSVHDRMPVILRPRDEDKWLDPDLKNIDRLFPLLVPYPSDMMEGYEVSTLVNSPKNDVPECILPEGGQ